MYPIVFIDAIHFSVRDEHIVKKIAAYIILGINDEGKKEVLSITIGENESAKYWLGVLNELKNRGVRDILILCADGLSGIKESIAAAYPNTEYQRCIVHQVRNTLKYVAEKDKKAFANDLKSIYHAPNEESGYERMQSVDVYKRQSSAVMGAGMGLGMGLNVGNAVGGAMNEAINDNIKPQNNEQEKPEQPHEDNGIVCENCGAKLPEGAKFCLGCCLLYTSIQQCVTS